MLDNLSIINKSVSKSISAENPTGEKGKGGMATEGTGAGAAEDLGQGWKVSAYYIIKPGEVKTIADYKGFGMIKHIWCTDSGPGLRNLIIRMYWDGSENPSVEVPLGDFFASPIYNKFFQISSLAVCVNPNHGFNCYWTMPFKKGFKMTIENIHDADILFFYQIDFEETELPENIGYFHAQFRRVNPLPYKEVYTIADNIKGRGKFVGTQMLWGVNNNGWWGEGEIKFYIDGDKEFPTICGTGTEDYFCGAFGFAVDNQYKEYTTPYAGMPMVTKGDGLFNSQQRFSLYRWHINDPVYFQNDLKITIQALGWRNGDKKYLPLQDDISSVAYWYQDTISETMPTLPDKDYLEII